MILPKKKKKERIRKFLMALHNDREKANGLAWLGKNRFNSKWAIISQ